jgi:TPR repeat protein
MKVESERPRYASSGAWNTRWDGLGRIREKARRHAEEGYAKYQSDWAFYKMLEPGRDLAESARWFRKAADQGYAPAQFYLGLMSDIGEGVGQDYVEAAKWYRKAADQGLPPAQFNLGVMYDKGVGVAQDYGEAATLYRKAADHGLAPAQFNLAIKYEKGEGVAQDSAEAAKWYRKAADRDYTPAQFNLGLKYTKGQGLVRDDVQAYTWMTVATRGIGVDDSERYAAIRDSLAAKMNPVQVAEARHRALEWETSRCNKCGEQNLAPPSAAATKSPLSAPPDYSWRPPRRGGGVCASCNRALDRQWAGSAATDWFITWPFNEGVVEDHVMVNTTYAQMKSSWAVYRVRNWALSGIRPATPDEVVYFNSQWGTWSHSDVCIVRPATPEDVADKEQGDREWGIASDIDKIMSEVCRRLGVDIDNTGVPIGDPQKIKQAAVEIVERLQQLELLEELAKMKREDSDALGGIEHDEVLKTAGLW